MKSIDRLPLYFVSLVVLLLGVAPAWGDWDPGDPYKMHWPQLPDPNGWDVRISSEVDPQGQQKQWIVADDWLCTDSGPVSDVHFWVSWWGGKVGNITRLHLSVHDDVPVGPNNPYGYSYPERPPRWERDFSPTEFAVRLYGSGEQGWYDPLTDGGRVILNDHQQFFQINVVDIVNPFMQEKGKIYWLDISADVADVTTQLGWKTSISPHFNDDAVIWDENLQRWLELRDPLTQESLDMAFVIVPEPATIWLLGMGAVGLLVVVRRSRRSAP
jgi:hypothetical protein